MTMQSYIEYLDLMLGGDFVEVEIRSKYDRIISQSLGELMEYLRLNKFITVPYANRIDMTEYNVSSIVQVYRTQAADSTSGTAGSTDAFLLAAGMVQGVPYNIERYTQLLQIRKIKNTMSTDLDYRFDDPYLYITQNPMQSAYITIEYTPKVTSVEDITDEYWIGKLKKLSLANAKIILGRVRGKYRSANSLYENDAAQILQEGMNEKTELINFLQDNKDILLPIGS